MTFNNVGHRLKHKPSFFHWALPNAAAHCMSKHAMIEGASTPTLPQTHTFTQTHSRPVIFWTHHHTAKRCGKLSLTHRRAQLNKNTTTNQLRHQNALCLPYSRRGPLGFCLQLLSWLETDEIATVACHWWRSLCHSSCWCSQWAHLPADTVILAT